MKILILNGSPRKGNTLTAITAFADGARANNEIEIVDTYKLKVSPCMACDACECSKGCVAADDSNMIIDKMVAADMIVFASPVYWWGITAQMKLVIDKAYCRGALLKGKKIGVVIVGGSYTDNEQYKLIRGQFNCISEYLNWNILFHKDYSASGTGDLAKDIKALEDLRTIGEEIK